MTPGSLCFDKVFMIASLLLVCIQTALTAL
jgi:hypothetical protein